MGDQIENLSESKLVELMGQATIGTPAGNTSQQAGAELIKRLIIHLSSLNKATTYYSKILIWLTIALVLLGIIQIVSFFVKL